LSSPTPTRRRRRAARRQRGVERGEQLARHFERVQQRRRHGARVALQLRVLVHEAQRKLVKVGNGHQQLLALRLEVGGAHVGLGDRRAASSGD
jgi:hypothetical protein